jgi:hypothetical protein
MAGEIVQVEEILDAAVAIAEHDTEAARFGLPVRFRLPVMRWSPGRAA